MLQPDQGDTLLAILQELQHPGSAPPAEDFLGRPYAIRVNCFLFAGLFLSMMVAFLSILVKQWTRNYQRDLSGVSSAHLRARIRHFRYRGAKQWRFSDIVGILSICMHISLLLSAIGIIDLLLSTAPPIGFVALALFLLGIAFFFGTTLLPLVVPNAPFRSPLSRLLTGVKRILLHHHHQRAIDNGLEDHLEQSQGRESKENSIVRTMLDLDLDILCHLLSETDKSTERGILDLCFSKLPQLTLLEKTNPESILEREIILEVYIFLAKGCIIVDDEGKRLVNSRRMTRAKGLCEFIAWFLSLKRSPTATSRLRRILESGFSPKELPLVLKKAAEKFPSLTDTVTAISALGRIEHLLNTNETEPCQLCENPVQTAKARLPQSDGEVLTVEVLERLIHRTDCVLFYQREDTGVSDPTGTLEKEAKALGDLLSRFKVASMGKRDLEKILGEKKMRANEFLKDNWFAHILRGIQDMSTPSNTNFNVGSTTRSSTPTRNPPQFHNTSSRTANSTTMSTPKPPIHSNR